MHLKYLTKYKTLTFLMPDSMSDGLYQQESSEDLSNQLCFCLQTQLQPEGFQTCHQGLVQELRPQTPIQ